MSAPSVDQTMGTNPQMAPQQSRVGRFEKVAMGTALIVSAVAVTFFMGTATALASITVPTMLAPAIAITIISATISMYVAVRLFEDTPAPTQTSFPASDAT